MNNDFCGLTIFILTILWGIIHFITSCRIDNLRKRIEDLKENDEILANMQLPKFTVNSYKVDTLKFQRSYPADLIIMGEEDKMKSIITRDLVDDLVLQMDKYVTVRTFFEPHKNWYRVVGEVKVVKAESEEAVG